MRHSGLWLCALPCLLSACAGTSSRPGAAALSAPQARDCGTLFPHQDAPPLEVAPGILPAGLAEAGARRLALSHFYKCRQDNLSDQNRYLQALGDALQAQKLQLQSDVAAYQQRLEAAQAASADYTAACQVPGLDQARYQDCLQRQQQVNQDIAQVNAIYPALEHRKGDQDARIGAYDRQVGALPGELQAADQEYQSAVREQGRWLDTTRGLLAAPMNQAVAAGAACPPVQPPPRTLPEMDALSLAFMACLARMPATLLMPAASPPVAVTWSASAIAPLAGTDDRPQASIYQP